MFFPFFFLLLLPLFPSPDLTDLHYLYPDRPKDECFGPHYKIEVPVRLHAELFICF